MNLKRRDGRILVVILLMFMVQSLRGFPERSKDTSQRSYIDIDATDPFKVPKTSHYIDKPMPDWDGRPESRHTSRDNDDSMSTFDEVKVEQPHEGHSLYHDEERQDQSNYEGRSHSDHGNDDGRLNDDRANFHEDQLHDDYRKFEEVPVHRGPEYSSRDSDFSEHFKGPSREEERNPQRDVNNNYDQPSNDERESSPRESENMQSNSKDEDGADSNMYDDHSHRTGEGRHNVPRVEYETEQDSTADPEADEKYEESNNGPD